ncbi:MAG TPA: hypothetical protein VJ825_13950 [Gemmatimonadaceae bacterium]|nr:hypothetical protein [Gemmatimonadaceae bacterium]
MSTIYLLVAAGYAFLAFTVAQIEFRRTRNAGVDITTVFLVLCLLQCCLPGIAIYSALPFIDRSAPTGIDAFDRIYYALNPTTALVVLSLTAWFVLFIYVGAALGRLALRSQRWVGWEKPPLTVSISLNRILWLLIAGLLLTLLSFYRLGDTLFSRYANLILLRGGDPEIQRTALNANAFALTQSWGWLSIVAIFTALERRGRGWPFVAAIVLAAIFAVLSVSRRALFLPIVFSYLAVSLYHGRFRLRWVALAGIPMILWLAYGKELLASIAFGIPVESVSSNYQSWMGAVLRAASDTGLTIVESVGTLTMLHLWPRFGVDHVLSLAQRFPEGILGWDFNFPERIVRVSTTAFADANAQDIPPGVIGQMWLDFRVFGPVIWGLFFGFQLSVLQAFYDRTTRSYQSAAMFVLLAFLVVLPVNTGSFDFSFSVDVFAVLMALVWCARVRPEAVESRGPVAIHLPADPLPGEP